MSFKICLQTLLWTLCIPICKGALPDLCKIFHTSDVALSESDYGYRFPHSHKEPTFVFPFCNIC